MKDDAVKVRCGGTSHTMISHLHGEVVVVVIGAILVQGTHEEGDVVGWVRVGGQEARGGDGED